MKRFLLMLVIIALPIVAFADESTPLQTIKWLGTGWGGEGIYLTTNEGSIVENCVLARLVILEGTPMYEEMLSIALSAYHSKSKVEFRVSGCHGENMNVIAVKVVD